MTTPATKTRPPIVCLCGSARFTDAYREAIAAETLAGRIVVYTPDLRAVLDALPEGERAEAVRRVREYHLRLIDLCDRVKVLNPGGYVGDSTRDEIRYARQHHKGLEFMEPVDADWLAEVTGVEVRGFAEITAEAGVSQ
jgi:hypothetical protein